MAYERRGELDLSLTQMNQTVRRRQNRGAASHRTVYREAAHRETAYRETSRQTSTRRVAARRKRQLRRRLLILEISTGILVLLLIFAVRSVRSGRADTPESGGGSIPVMGELLQNRIQGIREDIFVRHPAWTEDYLTVSEWNRPGDPIGEVKNIFVHYTANPETSAAQNRSYFENLAESQERGASAHFIIGYEGEILQIIPLDEMAYAVQTRNEDSISIECCYLAKDGQFTQETYDSLIELLAWLLEAYDLEPDDILRHYDCGGKKCPLYYVEHEDAWEILRRDAGEKRQRLAEL